MEKKSSLNKTDITNLLPHREPMLLIDELTNIVHLHSAKAIMYVKKNGFYVNGHFPGNPVMPGVLIVEAFGQAAAALTAHGIDKNEYENKLVDAETILDKIPGSSFTMKYAMLQIIMLKSTMFHPFPMYFENF